MLHLIYRITNLINGKYYIGKHSTHNPDDGYWGSSRILWRALAKYGIENFKKEILSSHYTEEEAYVREAELVTQNQVDDPMCYNLCPGGMGGVGGRQKTEEECKAISLRMNGVGNPMFGQEHNELTKLKIGMANRGKVISKIHRMAISKANSGNKHPMFGKESPRKGKFHTEEAKMAISMGLSSKPKSEEHRSAISSSLKGKMTGENNPFFGKSHTEDTLSHLSLACKIAQNRPEVVERKRQANLGKTLSEETKQKMSLALKGKEKPKIVCPHCGQIGAPHVMKRWHFDNCKNLGNT